MNGAEIHFRGSGTMFRTNYCATPTDNSSVTKTLFGSKMDFFLFKITAEHLSVESPSLLLID